MEIPGDFKIPGHFQIILEFWDIVGILIQLVHKMSSCHFV